MISYMISGDIRGTKVPDGVTHLVQIKTQGHNIQMFPAIIAQLWLEPVRSNNEYLSDYLFCQMDICA